MRDYEGLFILAMIVGVLAFAVGITIWQASMEAKSYRKFCDTPVTWVDALFLDLRIDECGCGDGQ